MCDYDCLHRLWSHKGAARERGVRSTCFDLQEGEDCILGRGQPNLP